MPPRASDSALVGHLVDQLDRALDELRELRSISTAVTQLQEREVAMRGKVAALEADLVKIRDDLRNVHTVQLGLDARTELAEKAAHADREERRTNWARIFAIIGGTGVAGGGIWEVVRRLLAG
jgi:hypothetical protein